jgi:hypothetical protein
VAKKHNLHALSHKSLAEKRIAVESHVCTLSCDQCVTVFKPVKKKKKTIQCQHRAKVFTKEIKPHLKVVRKSQGKAYRSAQMVYEILRPYVVSTKVQLKNPDEFGYVYRGHLTPDNAIQEIQTSGEAQLVCNMPLALLANILI